MNLRLVAEGNVFPGHLSRDGSTLVFSQVVDGRQDIFRFREGQVERLTDDPGRDSNPAVSDDGEVVVWSRRTSEGSDIYCFRDGKTEALAPSPAVQAYPSVSGDGAVVVWQEDKPGDEFGPCVIRWEAGRARAVVEPREGESLTHPRVTSDGSSIFFELDQGWERREFWVHGPSGSRRLLETRDDWVEARPSAEGNKVLYSAYRGGDRDLFVLETGEGTSETVADKKEVDETFGTLSGDGTHAVYNIIDYRELPEVRSHLYHREGDRSRQLVGADAEGNHLFPQISDDGRVVSWTWVDKADPTHRRLYLAER